MSNESISPATTVQIQNISKSFKLYNKPIDRLKECFHPFNKKYHHDFIALNNISFSVSQGEILGIIGKNGAGKSTLLQIITGVMTPTSGNLNIKGSISALLELGAGFNPELSGMDNIFFKSSLLGYSSEQIKQKIDNIIDFADIGEFIIQPVKTYSTGMYIRLAFAVAINVDPEILIIDEALSVGDYRFRLKCLRVINTFMESGKTIIFVSHDMGSVIEFCTKVIWLKDGIICAEGPPKDICKDYLAFMAHNEVPHKTVEAQEEKIEKVIPQNIPSPSNPVLKSVEDCSMYGKMGAKIIGISFVDARTKKDIKIFQGGIRVILSLKIKMAETLNHPIIGFHIVDANGVQIAGINTAVIKEKLKPFQANQIKLFIFEFNFPQIKIGHYSITPAIADGTYDNNDMHHWIHDAYLFDIASNQSILNSGYFIPLNSEYSIDVK